jgi:hypothetical protein
LCLAYQSNAHLQPKGHAQSHSTVHIRNHSKIPVHTESLLCSEVRHQGVHCGDLVCGLHAVDQDGEVPVLVELFVFGSPGEKLFNETVRWSPTLV